MPQLFLLSIIIGGILSSVSVWNLMAAYEVFKPSGVERIIAHQRTTFVARLIFFPSWPRLTTVVRPRLVCAHRAVSEAVKRSKSSLFAVRICHELLNLLNLLAHRQERNSRLLER